MLFWNTFLSSREDIKQTGNWKIYERCKLFVMLYCSVMWNSDSTLFHNVYPSSSISCERKYWRWPLTLVELQASFVLSGWTYTAYMYVLDSSLVETNVFQGITTNRKSKPRLNFVGLENWTKCWEVSLLKNKGVLTQNSQNITNRRVPINQDVTRSFPLPSEDTSCEEVISKCLESASNLIIGWKLSDIWGIK